MNIYQPIIITEQIVKSFVPSKLYIKELAGVKYFGKTTAKNAERYTGSGKIWKARIRKYGKENIKTLWVSDTFYCPYAIQEVALKFSIDNSIVESKEWANLKPENGLDGGSVKGTKTKESMIKTHQTKLKNGTLYLSEETKQKMRKPKSAEALDNMRKAYHPGTTGKIWVHNGIEEKMIKDTDMLEEGWVRGKLTNTLPPSQKGKKWANNGVKSKMVFEVEEGWVLGRLK